MLPKECREWSEKRRESTGLRRENLHDFFDSVPIARGCWHTEELLDLAEVADRFHLPAI